MTGIIEDPHRHEAHVLTDDLGPTPTTGAKYGKPLAVVKPGSAEEVAAVVVKLCAETGTPIVPQAGNTGLVAAVACPTRGRQLVLNVVAPEPRAGSRHRQQHP